MSETTRILQTLQRMLPPERQLSGAFIAHLYNEIIEYELPEWLRRGKERRQESLLPRHGIGTILRELQRMIPPSRHIPAGVIEWLAGELTLLEYNPDWPAPYKSVIVGSGANIEQRDKETAA